MIVSFLVILGTFFYIMNHSYLQVEGVEVTGQRTLIDEDIQKTVNNFFEQRRFGLIPKSNILFLNVKKIQSLLTEAYPKIQDIDVKIDQGDILEIHLGERQAHSLWCIDKKYESVFDEECYFADQKGLLYTRAPYFSGNVYLKIYMEENIDQPLSLGESVFSVEEFGRFFRFIKALETNYTVRISQIFFDNFKDVRIELARVNNVLYNNVQPFIIYNTSDDYETILRNIGITLEFETFKKDFSARAQSLESIDVRFPERIFYTFTPNSVSL